MNINYPRTFHAPWSESLSNDDKRISTMADLIGQRVVVLEKMDGENLFAEHAIRYDDLPEYSFLSSNP